MAGPVLLKKYSNRRLYDTEKSIYVTLAEVAGIVRSGRSVEVRDAQTKEDVTAFILTQIILEDARNKNALLPVPLLHLIIQFGNNQLSEFLQTYLQQIALVYLAERASFEEQFKRWLGSAIEFSAMTRSNWVDAVGLKSFFELPPFLKSQAAPEPSRNEPGKDNE